jgi:hypothetical protein
MHALRQAHASPLPGRRWREAQAAQSGGLWVGAVVDSVEVDDWGKFKFVLVRLRDGGGRQKMLVRGGNYASEGALVEALHRQARASGSESAPHGVSFLIRSSGARPRMLWRGR